jgi:NADPH2:quinone reductase
MRAAVLHEMGGVPEPGEVDEPVPAPGEVLVAVDAAGLNPADVLQASGAYPVVAAVPYVIGREAAGRTADGRRVWFMGPGAMAERAAVPADALVELPDDLPTTTAAGLGLAGTTALLGLRATGGLRPGEAVLVLGASGAVGTLAVQLARVLGAGRVVGAGRSAAALAHLAGRADALVHADDDWAGALAGAAPGGGFDLVLDPVWGPPAAAAVDVLAPGGRLATVGSVAGPATLGVGLLARGASIRAHNGFHMPPAVLRAAYAEVAALVAAGRVVLPTEAVPLGDVGAAWRRLTGAAHPKLVITPAP